MNPSSVTSAEPPSNDGQPTAKIIVTVDHIAVLDPAVPELEPVLLYPSRSFRSEGECGWTEHESVETLCKFEIRDRVAFPAGLLGRVKPVLRQLGYRVVVDDQRHSSMAVNSDLLPRLTGRNKALIRAMARHPLGRIEIASDERAKQTFELLDETFPKTSFVVAAATVSRAVALWNDVYRVVTDKPGLAVPHRHFAAGRWLVGTYSKIDPSMFAPDAVLILPDAEDSTGIRFIEWVARMGFPRCYAFVRPGRKHDRRVQLRLEQLAGPLIHRSARPRVPVKAIIMPLPIGAIARQSGNALERKREWYWRNAARNEYIANVAMSIAEDRRDDLRQMGLADAIATPSENHAPSIAVIVESPEHGREMAAWLPGWPLLMAYSKADVAAGGEAEQSTPALAIVTSSYAAMYGVTANVIIRGTGTAWPLRIKRFPPERRRGTPTEILVIDFQDGFHAGAGHDAGLRRTDYLRRGYRVVEPDPRP